MAYSYQGGSDMEQTSSERGYRQKKGKGKYLASVRALAIKKGVLTHEVDEGSPCLRCGDNCPGFSLHFWRKVCKNCLCQREEHDIGEHKEVDTSVHVGKLLFSPTVDTLRRTSGGILKSPLGNEVAPSPKLPRHDAIGTNSSPDTARKMDKYLWLPGNCSIDTVHAYFEALPVDKVPVRGTPGERYRHKQLLRQVPTHDIDMSYCNNLSLEEKKQMEIFLKLRKEKALGKGEILIRQKGDQPSRWTCGKCTEVLNVGQVAVFTERGGSSTCFHPACFTCATCDELLVDLIYFFHEKDREIYCGRHHAEKIKPRCTACDELIFCREYTRAENSDWHMDHFCCLHCDAGLGGQQYRAQDGMPYCLSCYEMAFSTVCETCGHPVGLNESRLSYENTVWHGTEGCFHCAICKVSLVESPFLPKYGKLFCSKDHAKQYKKQITIK